MVKLVAAGRAVLCLLWMVLLLPGQLFAVRFSPRLAKAIPRLFHRGTCRILGIRVTVGGEPADAKPVLYVSNHTTYFDITVLGAVLKASFVAKQEIAGWPIFGLLAKLQRSVFVARRAARAGVERNEMVDRLEAGDNLILFPEGTSSDGNRVLDFNSTFFAVAERPIAGKPLTVQPVTIAFTRHNGLPISRGERPGFAWYGDMEMFRHLWGSFQHGAVDVIVRLHDPVDVAAFGTRKALARHCHAVVAGGFADLIAGREPSAEAVPAPALHDRRRAAWSS